MPHGMVIMVL